VDGNPSYPRAIAELKQTGELGRPCRCRAVRYLNNMVRFPSDTARPFDPKPFRVWGAMEHNVVHYVPFIPNTPQLARRRRGVPSHAERVTGSAAQKRLLENPRPSLQSCL
jgi:hypothetical protein